MKERAYIPPFEDKEHFDQVLFDSIQLPPKPMSAKLVLLILTVPVLALTILAGPAGLFFELPVVLVYGMMRTTEKDWEWKAENFEQYRIMMYNLIKSDPPAIRLREPRQRKEEPRYKHTWTKEEEMLERTRQTKILIGISLFSCVSTVLILYPKIIRLFG